MALLDPDAVLREDAAAVALGSPEEVSGAGSVAGFLRRVRGAKAAIVEGEPALVWAPGGRLRVILRFSTAGRSGEAVVRGRVKFRVGRLVYVAFSRDETEMGFGFPREEREAFVTSYPGKFLMPDLADLRYNWIEARLSALGRKEMRELVLDALAMCVRRSVADSYFSSLGAPGVARRRTAPTRSSSRQAGSPAPGSARPASS